MPEVAFSRLAESDLRAIDEYTERVWGVSQADSYLDQIQLFCQRLAEDPGMGRVWNARPTGLRRMGHRSHVFFYRQTTQGILISRILHKSMIPARQTFEEDNDVLSAANQ